MASEQNYLNSRRLQLHSDLVNLLGTDNVYFQPPSNINIKYPCIIYSLDNIEATKADNTVYSRTVKYRLTYVDAKPTSIMVDNLSKLSPKIRFIRHYVVDNLNHYVFTIYY